MVDDGFSHASKVGTPESRAYCKSPSGCKEVVGGTFNETVIKSAGELQASLISKQHVSRWHNVINGAPGKVSSHSSPGGRNNTGFIL